MKKSKISAAMNLLVTIAKQNYNKFKGAKKREWNTVLRKLAA